MLGFVYTSKPKNSGRENLDDIVIPKKLPSPIGAESWWPTAAREGFTALASRLFRDRQPLSTDEDYTRKSDWTGQ